MLGLPLTLLALPPFPAERGAPPLARLQEKNKSVHACVQAVPLLYTDIPRAYDAPQHLQNEYLVYRQEAAYKIYCTNILAMKNT